MIKNFRLYNKPKKGAKLCAVALAGTLILGSLAACSNTDNSQIFGQLPNTQTESVEQTPTLSKTFEPGEHIISIPIADPTKEVTQHTHHIGYKCIGMGTSTYGRLRCFGGACLLYTNEVEVECVSTNNKTFTEFGTPLNYEKDTTVILEDGTKTFGIGEHIISVPISDPTDRNIQYQFYEGYEVLDIAISAYGDLECFGGGVILYSNTVPVICTPTITKNNVYKYINFGTPVEPEETRTLVK